ncbi:hypothetical protein [Sulfoacidibacillus thermotolerans]|uniref:Flagellar protein n=1 Tax=Sulfoacidibacillus thermotolerans TaxID=1765684 RepID=A0A2U3D8Y4_SULT2|nr:hypothetical protein [Sulfoacidibacillus thermotolerans]PWI57738.1 hypothetical protein BM613_07060 [Sulfoacidibacillus thermotolerans]
MFSVAVRAVTASFRTCEQCGKVFLGVRKICDACFAKEEQEFELVSDYLRDHPNAQAKEVSDETGVEVAHVMKWVKEGRLIARINYACERCGATIHGGRYCAECTAELGRDLQKTKAALLRSNDGYYSKR